MEMVIMEINRVIYIPSDNHTIGYYNECRRIVGENNCREYTSSDFRKIIANTFEDALVIAETMLKKYLASFNGVYIIDKTDFRFMVKYAKVKDNNLFWYPLTFRSSLLDFED